MMVDIVSRKGCIFLFVLLYYFPYLHSIKYNCLIFMKTMKEFVYNSLVRKKSIK